MKNNSISKFSMLLAILALLTPKSSEASIFTISPYAVLGSNRKINLKFKLKEKVSLSIYRDTPRASDKQLIVKHEFTENVLHLIDLGSLGCSEHLSFTFKEQKRERFIGSLRPIPCKTSDSLTFGFMSDTQVFSKKSLKRAMTISNFIKKKTQSEKIPFIVNAGDLVQHGGQQNDWQQFFRVAGEYLKGLFILSTVGNHEYFNSKPTSFAPSEFLKYLRTEEDSRIGYIYWEFSNFVIVALNSNFKFLSEANITAQYLWLESKLKINKESGLTTIITMHHSPFSSSLEHLRSIPRRLREQYVPLFEKYKESVKLVLTGHLHLYERSEKKGIQYVVSGPSGGKRNPVTFPNSYSKKRVPFSATFSTITINTDHLKLRTYNVKNQEIDSIKIPL